MPLKIYMLTVHDTFLISLRIVIFQIITKNKFKRNLIVGENIALLFNFQKKKKNSNENQKDNKELKVL